MPTRATVQQSQTLNIQHYANIRPTLQLILKQISLHSTSEEHNEHCIRSNMHYTVFKRYNLDTISLKLVAMWIILKQPKCKKLRNVRPSMSPLYLVSKNLILRSNLSTAMDVG